MGFVSQLVTLIWLIVEQSAVEQPVQTRLGLSGVPGTGRAGPGERSRGAELGMSSGCPEAELGCLTCTFVTLGCIQRLPIQKPGGWNCRGLKDGVSGRFCRWSSTVTSLLPQHTPVWLTRWGWIKPK